MAFNERSIKLADQIAAAAKANGETVFHGKMEERINEWGISWEGQKFSLYYHVFAAEKATYTSNYIHLQPTNKSFRTQRTR